MQHASRQKSGDFTLHQQPLARAIAAALLTMAIGATIATPAIAQTNAPAAAASKSYNIPAGSLSQVLYSFAGNAGITLSFEPSLTEGLRSNGLQGNYSIQQGLDTLLSAHHIEAIPGAGGGYRLRRVVQDASTLPAVNVTSAISNDLPPAYAGGQVARGGSLGLLGTQDVLNTPFSTVNYTSELIEDQQARTLADIVVNDASIRTTTGSGGFDEGFQIRGFSVGSGEAGFNGLYGLISSSRIPTQMVERAEILKGPGTLMNGMPPGGSIGGSINTVLKRAKDAPLTRLTTTYQSESMFGAHLDIGRRFGENNEWGIRFNGLMRDGEGSVNGNDHESKLGALAVDYRGSKLRWSLDMVAQREDIRNYRPQVSLSALSGILAPPDARTNWFPGTSLQQADSTIATRVDYDFSDSLSGFAAIGYRDGHIEQLLPTATSLQSNGNFNSQSYYYDSYSRTRTSAAGLLWKFDTASVKHTVSVGVNRLWQTTGNASTTQPGTTTSNIYNPSPIVPMTVDRAALKRASDQTLDSFAISNTMSFANDRFLITLGARDQTVDYKSWNTTSGAANLPYKSSSLTPVVGIVFKPVHNVSVYANHTSGLSRGSIVGAGYANTGDVLAPFKSKQYEGGVKIDWGKFTTTASIYQIERPATQDTIVTPPTLPTRGYFGEQRNRGLELTTYGELRKGLRGIASIAFVDAKLTSTSSPTTQGKKAAGIPDTTASASLDWDTPWLAGLALNTRVIYTAGSFMNNTNTMKFDSWTRYDIGARYRTVIGGKPVVLRANVENLFDKNYWLTAGSYVAVGAPRTLVISAMIDF